MDFLYKTPNTKTREAKQDKKSVSHRNNNMPEFKQHLYAKPETFCRWEQGHRIEVRAALKVALKQLENALMDKNVENSTVLKDAIEKIIKVLLSPKLEIYPLNKKWLGQAQEGYNQISINMALLHKCDVQQNDLLFSIAKTLIHEAFHIIGGCVKGESNDDVCEGDMSKEVALKKIEDKAISSIDADFFAQFVMMC
ncbi:MAG: hypothetical protein NC409_00230 [Clostridium sp.]|nr:hypothetical protein [Clostridium sp.]